jgi:Spy/CpxP family protein refolding chaperone
MKRMLCLALAAAFAASVAPAHAAKASAARDGGGPPPAAERELDRGGDEDGPMSGMPGPPCGPMGARFGRGGPDGGMPGPPGEGPGVERLADLLEGPLALTSQQRSRLEDIRDRQLREDIRSEAEIRIARLDLERMIEGDAPDRAGIGAQIDRIAQMEAKLHKDRVGARLDARAVLTAEQLKKLRSLRGTPPMRGGPGKGTRR